MKLTALAVVILALGIAAGCGLGSSEPTPTATPTAPSTRALNGTMTLDSSFTPSGSDAKVGRNCRGESGYDDIQEGTQVTVRDGTDAIIATGRLSQGKLTATGFSGRCRFEFTISDVPEASFYTIEVSRRGGLTYSAEELDGLSWMVSFILRD